MTSHVPEQVKLIGDGVSFLAWVSVLAGQLTTMVGLLAAIASLGWAMIRLYETKTIQRWIERHRK